MKVIRKWMHPLAKPVPIRAKVDGEGPVLEGTTDGNKFFWYDSKNKKQCTTSWLSVD